MARLSLSKLERELFDPAKDPLLRPGFVAPDFAATDAECEAAAELLRYRREQFGWRLDALPKKVRKAVAEGLASRPISLRPKVRALADSSPPPVEDGTEAIKGRLKQPLPWKPLPFYRGGLLVHVFPESADSPSPAEADRILLFEKEGKLTSRRMDGVSVQIHKANKEAPFDGTVRGAFEEYIAFFCEHVHGDEGGFYVVEEAGVEDEAEGDEPSEIAAGQISAEPLIAASQQLPDFYHVMRDHRRTGELSTEDKRRYEAAIEEWGPQVRAELAQPITRIASPEDGDGRLLFIATLAYARVPSRVAFALESDGMIEMLEDRPIAEAAVKPLTPRWMPRRESR